MNTSCTLVRLLLPIIIGFILNTRTSTRHLLLRLDVVYSPERLGKKMRI